MARTILNRHSPRVAKKEFRAQAARKGLTFAEAAKAHDKELREQRIFPSGNGFRRNPGRMDGTRWNGDSFMCPRDVDGHWLDSGDDSDRDDLDEGNVHVLSPVSVSLLDIARPAKQKGIAKDFEVVAGVRKVIVLEDEHERYDADDDWEDLYDAGCEPRKPYSAVVKEHG